MAPRSQGCVSCRRQKVKCDEGRPVCTRCLHSKSRRDCVYLPRYQFRDEGPKFGVHSSQDSSSTLPSSRSPEPLRTELQVLSTKVQHGQMVQKFRLTQSRSETPTPSNPESSPQLNIVPSLSKMDTLAFSFLGGFQVAKGYQLQQLGSLVFEIPSRIGCNPALDAAVVCLLESQSELLRNAHRISSPQYRPPSPSEHLPSPSYMQALRKLQEAIEHPTMGRSSETVSAIILMGFYEIMIADKRGSQYCAHAGGSHRLIMLRGPEKVTTVFEKDLLRSQRGNLIFDAFIRRQDCVLVSDGWQEIRLEKSRSHTDQAFERLWQAFSRIPSLLKLMRDSKKNYSGGSNTQQLLEYSTVLQDELTSIWASVQSSPARHKELSFDTIAPLSLAHDMFPTAFNFHTPEGARFNNFYWTASLILNLARASIIQRDHAYSTPMSIYPPEVTEAAHNICMSCNYAESQKPLGALFINLPLVCSYFVSTELVKSWILNKLNDFYREVHLYNTKEYLDRLGGLIMGDLDSC